jgi:hypothetical protein
MYAEREHASKLAMILQNNFNDKNHTTFIPKEYYESLNPQQKAKFIRSQYEYQRMYRSIIVKGIRNVHLPTIIRINDTHLSIHEWLSTVKDYQQSYLFLQTTKVNIDHLELKCLETNLHIAKKWARHALTHISKVLRPIQLTSAFTDIDDLARNSMHAEEWRPPLPPMIEFMPDPRNAWKKDIPKTIHKSEKNPTTGVKLHLLMIKTMTIIPPPP